MVRPSDSYSPSNSFQFIFGGFIVREGWKSVWSSCAGEIVGMERNWAKWMLRNKFCVLGFEGSKKGESVDVNEY